MDGTMPIELSCPGCSCGFSAEPDTSADEVLDRMIDDGLWFTLAEGKTFEDMIIAAVLRRGRIRCGECGRAVSINEESLGRNMPRRFALRHPERPSHGAAV
jgi:hypothetical protein